MTMHRPVTGPDGDNTITDEQIDGLRAWYRHTGNESWVDLCATALSPTATWHAYARVTCAAAYNARHAGKDGR